MVYMTQKRLARQKSHPYYCDICGQDFSSTEQGREHFMKYHVFSKSKMKKVV
jgi:hypothetical protein